VFMNIWTVRLDVQDGIYEVTIRDGQGRRWVGRGADTQTAVDAATVQMVVKPWFAQR